MPFRNKYQHWIDSVNSMYEHESPKVRMYLNRSNGVETMSKLLNLIESRGIKWTSIESWSINVRINRFCLANVNLFKIILIKLTFNSLTSCAKILTFLTFCTQKLEDFYWIYFPLFLLLMALFTLKVFAGAEGCLSRHIYLQCF